LTQKITPIDHSTLVPVTASPAQTSRSRGFRSYIFGFPPSRQCLPRAGKLELMRPHLPVLPMRILQLCPAVYLNQSPKRCCEQKIHPCGRECLDLLSRMKSVCNWIGSRARGRT